MSDARASQGAGRMFPSSLGGQSGVITPVTPLPRPKAKDLPLILRLYKYTGGSQPLVVPIGYGTMHIEAKGAAASNYAGLVTADFAVSPGAEYGVYVGGLPSSFSDPVGGWNGGGDGGAAFGQTGQGGGGATDMRLGGAGLGDRVLVAGGSGGRSHNGNSGGRGGGDGGDPDGGDGDADGGHGGTQFAGGAGGIDFGTAGSLGQGGTGSSDGGPFEDHFPAGGGGGGLYGGGGGGDGDNLGDPITNPLSTGLDGGGGGGSSWVDSGVATDIVYSVYVGASIPGQLPRGDDPGYLFVVLYPA